MLNHCRAIETTVTTQALRDDMVIHKSPHPLGKQMHSIIKAMGTDFSSDRHTVCLSGVVALHWFSCWVCSRDSVLFPCSSNSVHMSVWKLSLEMHISTFNLVLWQTVTLTENYERTFWSTVTAVLPLKCNLLTVTVIWTHLERETYILKDSLFSHCNFSVNDL